MALSTLAQLAEQSKQLTSHIGGLQVPQIKRGIDQIESQSRKLAAKASKPTDGTDNKGYVAKSNSIAHFESLHLDLVNTMGLCANLERAQWKFNHKLSRFFCLFFF